MSKLRYYIDENVPVEVAAQLVQHGIEAVSAKRSKNLAIVTQTICDEPLSKAMFSALAIRIF